MEIQSPIVLLSRLLLSYTPRELSGFAIFFLFVILSILSLLAITFSSLSFRIFFSRLALHHLASRPS
ncbi:hypothetical protein BDW42DRAFT_33032 [Aspergillus taichungensis]|uniref:Uncharacterized protein n=1 Tax=Aspergillus taichungensis TaxID=482145 RepID=A0A2J5HFS0_9EURO|nr:hypothetical protein BDW42DRAFT_33032 [Aspergillus taichungensis]